MGDAGPDGKTIRLLTERKNQMNTPVDKGVEPEVKVG